MTYGGYTDFGQGGYGMFNNGNTGFQPPSVTDPYSSWLTSQGGNPSAGPQYQPNIWESLGSGIGGLVKGIGGNGIAALAGGLLGSQSGIKQWGTQTTTAAPWEPQQPYLLDMFNKAQSASNIGAMSPQERQAMAGMSHVAGGPTSNPYAGLDNPYLTSSINNASQDAMRNLMPAFDQAQRASGSFGNSGVAETFGRGAANTLGNIATNARMQNYGEQAQLAQQGVQNTIGSLGPLYSAGAASSLNPWSNLKNYGSVVTGNYGGTSSVPIYTNPINNALGGALAGSDIFRNMNQPQRNGQ